MSNISHFQNNEFIIPFEKVTHVTKFPPDRLDVMVLGGNQMTILGEDCKVFLQNYLGYLNAHARDLMSKAGQPA